MHAKTYRAPSQGERVKEANDRYLRESERRKVDAIKHEEKRIRETNKRERDLLKHSGGGRTLEVPYGSLGGIPHVRGRSHSFGGYAGGGSSYGSPYFSSSSIGYNRSPRLSGGGLSPRIGYGSMGRGNQQQTVIEMRRKEAELANLRAWRNALEEAVRRQRSASLMARESEALARAESHYLGSPHFYSGGSPYLGGNLGIPGHNSGYPLGGGGGLRRTRSFGSIPHNYGSSPRYGHHHQQYPYSPTLGYQSPRLQGHLASPRLGHKYPTYNDPLERMTPHLGQFDRLPPVDPLAYDYPGGGGDIGYGGEGGDTFVITDLDYDENGRQILSDLGWVEGSSINCASYSEDDRLNFAIEDLSANARQRGANAVMQVETGEDAAGRGVIIVRGRGVVLG